ncbi:MAG: GNAT family N-acetyltransferase [Nereida ignava]
MWYCDWASVGRRNTSTGSIGVFLDPVFWGRGIATIATGQTIEHLFATTTRAEITSGYFSQNRASGRVLEKLGFMKGPQRMLGTRHFPIALHQSMHLPRSHWQAVQDRKTVNALGPRRHMPHPVCNAKYRLARPLLAPHLISLSQFSKTPSISIS